jgi:hypothetical protein
MLESRTYPSDTHDNKLSASVGLRHLPLILPSCLHLVILIGSSLLPPITLTRRVGLSVNKVLQLRGDELALSLSHSDVV